MNEWRFCPCCGKRLASREIDGARLNEELAEFRLIVPERLKAWDYGTGLAVADWLAG